MKQKDLIKYFNKKKPIAAVVVLIAVLYFYPVLSTIGVEIRFFTWIVAICNAYSLYRFLRFQNDRAVDMYCNRLAEEYHKEQRKLISSYKIEIEDKIEYSGYLFENMFCARKARVGKDGISRSSITEMACTYISKDMIYNYDKRCSLLSEEKSQNQREFCIADIQMISVENINQTIAVVLTITGNEKVYLRCGSRDVATKISDKLKDKIQNLKV